VVETHLHHGSSRQVCSDVTADAAATVVRLQDHGNCIPANNVANAYFEIDIPGIGRLLTNIDGVFIVCVERGVGERHAAVTQVRLNFRQELAGAVTAVIGQHVVHRIEPFLLLLEPVVGSQCGGPSWCQLVIPYRARADPLLDKDSLSTG